MALYPDEEMITEDEESGEIENVDEIQTEQQEGTTSDSMYDIGKLLDLVVNVNTLSRDDKYRLLTTESNPSLTVYPFSRPCPSSCYHRFRPEWVKR